MTRALVLSGGGAKGGFSVGCLQYLMGELHTNYEVLCGVSVGAINVSFLSQFAAGQESEAATQLKHWWLKLDDSKIYKRWQPFGKLHCLWHLSFFDSSPLKSLIYENISLDAIRESGKKVSVGTASINSGKYMTIDQDDDNFIDAILASSAFPMLLNPIKIKDQLFIDGGCKELSPIRMAIEQDADEIDIITSAPEVRTKRFIEKPSIIDIVKRVIDISTDTILENDIERVLMYNKLAEAGLTDKKPVKIRIFRPHNSLLDDILNFDPQKIQEMIEIGYEDARRIIEHNKEE